MRIIRAILFDLGDTLWHTLPSDAAVALTAAGRQVAGFLHSERLPGCLHPAALAQALQEAGWRESAAAYEGDLRSPDFAELAMRVARAFGLLIDRAQGTALWEAAHGGAALPARALLPGARATLAELHRRGIALALVTNRSLGGAALATELETYGLRDYFAASLASCDAGWMKPHPAIFTAAACRLAIAPQQIAVVGDSLRADVSGARAAGMLAVWLRPHLPHPKDVPARAEPDDGPHHVIGSLPELQALPVRFEPQKRDRWSVRGAIRE